MSRAGPVLTEVQALQVLDFHETQVGFQWSGCGHTTLVVQAVLALPSAVAPVVQADCFEMTAEHTGTQTVDAVVEVVQPALEVETRTLRAVAAEPPPARLAGILRLYSPQVEAAPRFV